MRDPDCIFCKVVAGEIPGEIVDSDDRTITVMDINPATRGHVVVIPREHAENLLAVSEEDLAATMDAVRRMVERMQEHDRTGGLQHPQQHGPRRLAVDLPLPRARDSRVTRTIRSSCRGCPSPPTPAELAAVAAELRR